LTEKFDVTVVGGGPGGYVAAIKASQLGAKVALVNKSSMGGTCLNRGCIPTKSMVKSASLWRELQEAGEFGIEVENPRINYDKVLARQEKVVKTLVAGTETLMKKNKIEVFSGAAAVEQPGKVTVSMEDGSKLVLETDKIIIATGSTTARIPVPGLDMPGILTSDSILQLPQIPDSLTIIGGGVIGMEFASIFSAFGSHVTVVEMLPNILPMVDDEITKRLRPVFKKAGINILTKSKVKEVRSKGDSYETVVETTKGEEIITSSKVLLAAGRVPVMEGIDTEKLNLKLDGKAIWVNEKMETNVEGIYAVGDVVGGTMLAHAASFEGLIAAENAMGKDMTMDYSAVPSCIFCYPEIASVGLTENQAKEAGIDIIKSKFPFTANGKALTMGETVGTVKLIADKESGVIIGGHIMGPHATDLIAEITLAIKANLTGKEVAETIHAHPTLAETVMEAAHGLVDKPLHLA